MKKFNDGAPDFLARNHASDFATYADLVQAHKFYHVRLISRKRFQRAKAELALEELNKKSAQNWTD